MPNSCAFCGSTQPLTREHLFGKWVSKIGLDLSPASHHSSALNGLPRDLGVQPPYRLQVKNFCAACNNGWMSKMEKAAQRVLTPLILGNPGKIALEDQGILAMWAQKTALTAMLVSSDEQREGGYGLARSEYKAFYLHRERMQPLDCSRFWIGEYAEDDGFSAVRVTPLVLHSPRNPEPDVPCGYALTIVLGRVVVQGIRFTSADAEVDVKSTMDMPQLWPGQGTLQWPGGTPCTRESFLGFADGKRLRGVDGQVALQPWRQAAHMPESVHAGDQVAVPAMCRKHVVSYPATLLMEAMRGRFYAFLRTCGCQVTYLLHTDSDRSRFRAHGDDAVRIYKRLPGEEQRLVDGTEPFLCKRLPADADAAIMKAASQL
ncbi:hypothetical protein DBZ45_09015 [Arthrobacter globiformis]|uniref:HNH endonuclease n=2 Tax=Arthrobacter globiformis TaxID=1665 RepID=A0A328HKI2_ARTGO|nr:hypothetical protein DBZ45_09015 [Arthrobacter globiformis]